MPQLSSHLDTLGFDWSLVCIKWFICLFADVLPVEVCRQFVLLLIVCIMLSFNAFSVFTLLKYSWLTLRCEVFQAHYLYSANIDLSR